MKNFCYALCCIILFSCGQHQEKKPENSAIRPNILIIVADDLGFSDVGAFGGNIHTPVIDALGASGQKFSGLHVQPTCSPSRSSLLTGNDNHVAGFGIMEEMNYPQLKEKNLPGYAAHLSTNVVTLPELLRDNGYHTYMTGKWHLGEGQGKDPFDRGFEQSFILGTGGGSHYSDLKALSLLQHMDYFRNGEKVQLPDDFYSTRNYTDSMIRFIDMYKEDKKPFFGYLAYTAVHDPLHAPKDYIEKYKGHFDMGWDSLWMMRLKNLKSLGIIPQELQKFSRNPMVPKWETIPSEHRKELARDMEVYAAMLEYMDMSIGRVVDYLKSQKMYENTMIVFMSDNGANGAVATTYPGNEDGKYPASFDNSFNNRGLQNSYVETGPGWAMASSSPFLYFKTFASEGGIRAPLIIKMPGEEKQPAKWNHSFLHVTDLMPTILELTKISYPTKYKNNDVHALIGRSMLPLLNGDSTSIHTHHGMGWELFEMKAFIEDNWKILRLPQPMGTGQWQLFDLKNDPCETTDLSNEYPEVKKHLITEWNEYAKVNDVYDHNAHYDTLYRRSFK